MKKERKKHAVKKASKKGLLMPNILGEQKSTLWKTLYEVFFFHSTLNVKPTYTMLKVCSFFMYYC